jgi:hypothetical protein
MDGMPPDPGATPLVRNDAGMRRYLAIWAGSLTLMLAAVVVLGMVADPYSVIGTPRIAGLNARKPAAADWPLVSKAYLVQRAHPTTLIVGNSTADVGFNPESAAWPPAARPVFNLAVDGVLPSTLRHYLLHALAASHPAHVVISVNFTESLVMPHRQLSAATTAKFDYTARMLMRPDGTPNPDHTRAYIADIVFSTLSATAIFDSVSTLLEQNDQAATFETALGWNDGGKFRRWAREDGFYALFMNKDRDKAPQFARWREQRQVQVDDVADMVRIARSHGADVTIVIVPNHSDEMDMLRQLGEDGDYDAWKTRLVTETTAAGGGQLQIWDFSGYSRYTTESLPPPGDHTHRLRWFWEPVHFQAELGDLMIARMHGAAEPADFGVRLTPQDLPRQIAAFHQGEAAWVATHPADIARIAGVLPADK